MSNIILCTNARNESNILEWVIHHLNLGFNHIYIVDHKSDIPIKYVLRNVSSKFVTIDRLDYDIIKTTLIKNAVIKSLKLKFKWMLYLDCDEFLILNDDISIHAFIDKYKQYDQICINWLMFGSNNLNIAPINNTILETYTKCNTKLDKHVKTILNLSQKVFTIPNPHIYILPNMNNSVHTDYTKLNSINPFFYDNPSHYSQVSAYIAHYVDQAYDIYYKRKILLPRDDILNAYRTLNSKKELHRNNNNDINMTPVNKYNFLNKKQILKILELQKNPELQKIEKTEQLNTYIN